MSDPDTIKRERRERLKKKSAQAAVLNAIGGGAETLLRDSDEDAEIEEDDMAIQETNGNVESAPPSAPNSELNGDSSEVKKKKKKDKSESGGEEGAEKKKKKKKKQTSEDPENPSDPAAAGDSQDPSSENNGDTTSAAGDNQVASSGADLTAEVVDEDKVEMSEPSENANTASGHYSCFNCSSSLSGQRYILREEQSYCIRCYEELFANTCEACENRIGTDSKDLSYKEKHWHERCFKCSECEISLVDKLFGSRNEKLFCDNCYDEKFGAKCDLCTKVFKAGMKKLEWNSQQWHEECFKCTNCSTEIGCNSFMPKDNQQYCIQCFNDLFAPKCKSCSKAIMTGGVLYRNEPYHRDCFGCTKCQTNLVGQKFTSRENQPYCADCFGELFAKRCTSCTKPITGIGGTKFISFDGRHWHNECFNCNGPNCGENLVGKGFITDQQEILCPTCAKMPYTKREELKAQMEVPAAS